MAAVLDRRQQQRHEIFEIAGPETVTHRQAVRIALAAAGRPRRLVALPSQLILRGLSAYETLTGPIAMTTSDEADLLAATMLTDRGTQDAEALGVTPRRMIDVL